MDVQDKEQVIEVENGQIVRVNQNAPEGEVIPPGDNDPTNNQTWDYQSYASNSIIITTTQGKNDGSSTLVTQEVTNHVETSISGRLKFYMPRVEGEDNAQDNYGYHVSGGTIRQVARSGNDGDGNELIFYVETVVDPGEGKNVTLEYVGSEEQGGLCNRGGTPYFAFLGRCFYRKLYNKSGTLRFSFLNFDGASVVIDDLR